MTFAEDDSRRAAGLGAHAGSVDFSAQRATGKLHLRYEDLAQDGRPLLTTLPVALGVLWRSFSIPGSAREKMLREGILPILTRYSIDAFDGPFAIDKPLEVEGGFELTHARDDKGEVSRIFLDMRATLTGKKGRTNLPPPSDAGASAVAGTIDVEHVFTRPFAPQGERKITALDFDGTPFVPEKQRASFPARAAIELPKGAHAIDDAFVEDPTKLALGVMHTDSNQHVNSLVYPRLFEEAALRRFAALGRPTTVLARSLCVTYRRPSFAGESLRVFVRAFETDRGIACAGYFFGSSDDAANVDRARAFIQMRFE